MLVKLGRYLSYSFQLITKIREQHRSDRTSILLIAHKFEGGTLRHVQELSQQLCNHADILLLRRMERYYHLQWFQVNYAEISFKWPFDWGLFFLLRYLNIRHIHFHHTLGLPAMFWELPQYLNVSYDFTIHDYYSYCPQISLTNRQHQYCREPEEAGCQRCVQIRPTSTKETIRQWRERYKDLLEGANRVFTPSDDAKKRIHKHFPQANLIVVPHERPRVRFVKPLITDLADEESMRIVILGALSPIKGADVLEGCALDALRRNLPLEFHLIGYAYRSLKAVPSSYLKIYGSYQENELSDKLDQLKPHLAWFPALWPETYSYTLSAILKIGLPVVTTNLGAFSERLQGYPWNWQLPWDQTYAQWNDFFIHIRTNHFFSKIAPLCQHYETSSNDHQFDYQRDYFMKDQSIYRE